MSTLNTTSPTHLEVSEPVINESHLGNNTVRSESRKLMLAVTMAVALAGSAHAEDRDTTQLVAAAGTSESHPSTTSGSPIVTTLSASDSGTSILIAQAETGDRQLVAEVMQIDGPNKGKKISIKYSKDKRGGINPPGAIDGRLVDGSPAPSDEIDAKRKNSKIIVKYDMDALIILAVVGGSDILKRADEDLKRLRELSGKGAKITRDDIFQGFFSGYLYEISLREKSDSIMSGIETIAKVQVKLSDQEIQKIKQSAELRARETWRQVTGAAA